MTNLFPGAMNRTISGLKLVDCHGKFCLGYHVGGPAVPQDQESPRTCGPRTRCLPRHVVLGPDVPQTRCPPSEQNVPPSGGEMDHQTLTLQQIMDTQLVLLRNIVAFISQHICTNSKTMCSLPETLLHKTVVELG